MDVNNPKTRALGAPTDEPLARCATNFADPKIRIYDAGMKKYNCDAFPACVHLVRCVWSEEKDDATARKTLPQSGPRARRATRVERLRD